MKDKNGSILILVLVFGSIFILLFGGMVGFIFAQYRQGNEKVVFGQALNIAEAGANYSRWHLAHSPSDYDFSGIYDFNDPEGTAIGKYSLEVTPPAECSTIVAIKSTGWTNDNPEIKRTVSVRFGRPSLAQYAFITNTDVWFGENAESEWTAFKTPFPLRPKKRTPASQCTAAVRPKPSPASGEAEAAGAKVCGNILCQPLILTPSLLTWRN
jgi:hypothetical protein